VRRICGRRIGKHLLSLDFTFSAVTDDHFALAQLPASLQYLNLNACQEISERTCVQISDQCPDLRRIELYWNCRISDFGIKRLALACKKLSNINLSGCKYLTDKSIIPLIETCTSLEVLNLTRIDGVTSAAISAVSQHLPQLRELYLYANAGIADSAFFQLGSDASVVRNLEILDLCGCQLLEDDSLISLCRSNPRLSILNLTWCIRVTDKGIVEGVCGQSGEIYHINDGLELLSLFGNTLIT
jgi:F-box and leucine-rich repeat protein 2/20